jgi:hypothetical protein
MPHAHRWALALAVAGTALVLSTAPAFAHEQRQVGAFQFTVGWQHEPTYVGAQNGVQMIIKDAKGAPVDDLGSPPSLKVTVSTGSQTSDPLDLAASFDPDSGLGTHGEFDAPITPTAAGDYTFHITGTVNGQAVDEKFTSGPKTFDTVHDPSATQFPNKVPSAADLSTLTNRLSPRVDNALSQAKSNASDASSAHDLAVVGVILGAAGVALGSLLGGGSLLAARGRRSGST